MPNEWGLIRMKHTIRPSEVPEAEIRRRWFMPQRENMKRAGDGVRNVPWITLFAIFGPRTK